MYGLLRQRICGTVLMDHPDVQAQAAFYPIGGPDPRKLPDEHLDVFDGPKVWRRFITHGSNLMPPSGDWATAFIDAFKLNLNLRTCRVFFVVDLGKSEVLLGMDRPPHPPTAPSAQYTGQGPSVFNGYSIFDAAEYCFERGMSQRLCNNYDALLAAGTDLLAVEKQPFAVKTRVPVLCSAKVKTGDGVPLPVARRVYKLFGLVRLFGGNVGEAREAIKKSIYFNGPVLTGILVWPELLTWDGLGRAPVGASGSVVGGHSVVLYGWDGSDWIVQICWKMGKLGFVRLPMGTVGIEENAVALYPDLPNRSAQVVSMGVGGRLRTLWVDPLSFYTIDTIRGLGAHEQVNEDGTFAVVPKIRLPGDLIPGDRFVAALINKYEVPDGVGWSWERYAALFVVFCAVNYILKRHF